MDTGSIATIVGIILLIVINVASIFVSFGKITQRVKACEKVLFKDGLIEKLNECKISMTRVETKQNMLLRQSGITLPEGDKLP